VATPGSLEGILINKEFISKDGLAYYECHGYHNMFRGILICNGVKKIEQLTDITMSRDEPMQFDQSYG
jgi:hypothetical protein